MIPAIEVNDLAKRWTPSSGLRPVTLTVEAGEMVVVRGRSGSGKSTLLALLAGWCHADGGTASVAGELLGTRPPLWSQVAVVPQVLALVPELTIGENVREGCGDVAPGAVSTVLVQLDLQDLVHRTPAQVSMGQQQRAAVARAVVARPAVLLADEPTSHQDAGHGAAVVEALRDVARSGSAVLVASHDPEVAARADRVVDLTG